MSMEDLLCAALCLLPIAAIAVPLPNAAESVASPLNFISTAMPVNPTEKSNETDFSTNFTLTTSQTLIETAVSTTEFPEIIVFVNEINPSEPPSLNASSSAKDFNEKFKKAEEVGAIAGGVMAVIVCAIVLAIFLLYQKYHRESVNF
ncbi:conserved hypothetical protein [Echinococcus multilocularis]|uniref:Uncharacterized protein n=1 Tax=Echinococcus multilocularis TaxID=6211 RepID=A0A087VZV4_ECHMU|nr:conserved hypothetical protein [Echinococcus multilocularis]